MKQHLEKICDDFIDAQKTLAAAQPLLSMFAYPICAEMFIEKGIKPDKRTLKKCDRILVKKAGLFNDFSGLAAMVTVSFLAASKNPSETYDKVERARTLIKKNFKALPDHIAFSSIVLAGDYEEDEWEDVIEKTKVIYDALGAKGRVLTAGNDLIMSLRVASCGKDIEDVIKETEQCKKYLKGYAFSPKCLHALARIFAINVGGCAYKVDRFDKLYAMLKNRGKNYGNDYQLPMLGLAALIPESVEEIARDIVDVDCYLATKEPYSGLVPKYSSKVRLMHAAMLVVADYNRLNNADSEDADKLTHDIYVAMEVGIWTLFDMLFI